MKVPLRNSVISGGTVSEVSSQQFWKAKVPTEVTDEGISREVREVQPVKV